MMPRISQLGELCDLLMGEITGAQLVVEVNEDIPTGHRYAVIGARFESTIEHPRGRLVLQLSDCIHYSDFC